MLEQETCEDADEYLEQCLAKDVLVTRCLLVLFQGEEERMTELPFDVVFSPYCEATVGEFSFLRTLMPMSLMAFMRTNIPNTPIVLYDHTRIQTKIPQGISFDMLASVRMYSPATNSIGAGFMKRSNCSAIGPGRDGLLDLSGLFNLRSINDEFCVSCAGLTSVDLTGLPNLQIISHEFLSQCPKLTRFTFDKDCHLESVGRSFLENSAVEALDMRPFHSLRILPDCFLLGCVNIVTLDLSECVGVTTIGTNFLMGCSSIRVISLRGMTQLQHVGHSFLRDCTSLAVFEWGRPMGLVSIGHGMLRGCKALLPDVTTIDFCPCPVPFSVITEDGWHTPYSKRYRSYGENQKQKHIS